MGLAVHTCMDLPVHTRIALERVSACRARTHMDARTLRRGACTASALLRYRRKIVRRLCSYGLCSNGLYGHGLDSMAYTVLGWAWPR